jgi:hypothetical protein
MKRRTNLFWAIPILGLFASIGVVNEVWGLDKCSKTMNCCRGTPPHCGLWVGITLDRNLNPASKPQSPRVVLPGGVTEGGDGGGNNGDACRVNTDCKSYYCFSGVCAALPGIPGGNPFGGSGPAADGSIPDGGTCSSDQQCRSGRCNLQVGWNIGKCRDCQKETDLCGGENMTNCCAGLTCDSFSGTCQNPTRCTTGPSDYSPDSRIAVPLVITAYSNENCQGEVARFVMDTPLVAMAGQISSLRIYKGPNYIDGDQVQLYSNPNFVTGNKANLWDPDIALDPKVDADGPKCQNINEFGIKILSLRIYRPNLSSKPCADVGKVDPARWPNPITAIVQIYQDGNYGGMSEQIITNVLNLARWGMGNPGDIKQATFDKNISSVRALPGPDVGLNGGYETVVLYDKIATAAGAPPHSMDSSNSLMLMPNYPANSNHDESSSPDMLNYPFNYLNDIMSSIFICHHEPTSTNPTCAPLNDPEVTY